MLSPLPPPLPGIMRGNSLLWPTSKTSSQTQYYGGLRFERKQVSSHGGPYRRPLSHSEKVGWRLDRKGSFHLAGRRMGATSRQCQQTRSALWSTTSRLNTGQNLLRHPLVPRAGQRTVGMFTFCVLWALRRRYSESESATTRWNR